MQALTKGELMTFGEYRVGVDFNPSGNELVDKIKRAAADLIDLCEKQRVIAHTAMETNHTYSDIIRLWSFAMNEFESAAMWAVKAATKKPIVP